MSDLIYLDYASTTPCNEEVLAAMQPYFTTIYGNSNSLHRFGQEALDGLSHARDCVGRLINADFEEVIFTSGATEANNIAILRTVKTISNGGRPLFATFKPEHKSVLDCANKLKAGGHNVTYLDVLSNGLFDLDSLDNALSNNNIGLLSVCFVNNETGAIQNIRRIAEICQWKGILLHVDATQAFGKIPVDVKELGVDFMSASGHKIYGPKGIGILYCKKQNMKYVKIPRANYEVEFGVRSGTTPVPLCVGMGHASKIAGERMHMDYGHVKALREKLVSGITSRLEEIYVNGAPDSSYPGITSMSFRGCEGEAMMMEANKIAVSSGSACTSNKLSISHVLSAMGISADIAQSSLRISIGRHTTEEDIDIAVDNLIGATNKLREMSPVWDMIKAGMDVDAIFQRAH
ncbi:MAG: cysteine desulfurase [Holosporales bacterium]|jgi:cysteine desulfurase|nr:cysteine desulfurase [Holosporales bacterium]